MAAKRRKKREKEKGPASRFFAGPWTEFRVDYFDLVLVFATFE
jgi:hypothetical protein